MKTIAAGNEVAAQFMLLALADVAYLRSFTVEVMHAHLAGPVDGAQASGGACIHQVAGDLGLPIDHDAFAAGQAVHVNAVALALE